MGHLMAEQRRTVIPLRINNYITQNIYEQCIKKVKKEKKPEKIDSILINSRPSIHN